MRERWQNILVEMLKGNPGYSLSESTARARYSTLQIELKAFEASHGSGTANNETDVIKALRELEAELKRMNEARRSSSSLFAVVPYLSILVNADTAQG